MATGAEVIRILLIDDSPSVRRRFTYLFEAASDLELVAEVRTGAEAIRLIPEVQPDIICLDVFLETEAAASVVHAILSRPRVPIVLVSDADRRAPDT